MRAPFVFGMPSSHFDAAMLWSYPRSVQRRALNMQSSKGEATEFPNWSWCGWLGVSIQYRQDMIKDCIDNVHEWLNKRTWIKWYIRVENGDLRPLWDPGEWSIDRSEHTKWQGYRHSRSSGLNRARRPSLTLDNQAHVGAAGTPRNDGTVYHREYAGPGYYAYPPPPPPPPGVDDDSDWDLIENYDDTYRARKSRCSPSSSNERDSPPFYDRQDMNSFSTEDSESSGISISSDNVLDESEYQLCNVAGTVNGVEEVGFIDEISRRPISSSQARPKNISAPSPHEMYKRFIERWYEVARRNEIMRFLADLVLVVLRLLKYLLGFPTGCKPSKSPRSSLVIEVSDSESAHLSTEGQASTSVQDEQKRNNRSPGVSRGKRHTKSPPDSTQKRHAAMERPRRARPGSRHETPDIIEHPARPKRRKVRFDPSIHRPESPTLDPFAVGYNRDLMSPTTSGRSTPRMMRSPPPVPKSPVNSQLFALSEAKKFSEEECNTWSYYIPKEREESEWDLFYVLLIEWNDGKWKRVGLGKVFKEAFRDATWKEIVLA